MSDWEEMPGRPKLYSEHLNIPLEEWEAQQGWPTAADTIQTWIRNLSGWTVSIFDVGLFK